MEVEEWLERPGNSYHVTSCEVDVGGPGPTTNWFALYILEKEFPTSQTEYLCLGSCLVMEYLMMKYLMMKYLMMKNSTLFDCNPLPSPDHLASTRCYFM